MKIFGLFRWLSGKEYAFQGRRHRRYRFNPWVRKIPWSKKWQPTPVFLPGKFYKQRSLACYVVHGVAKSQIGLSYWAHTHTWKPHPGEETKLSEAPHPLLMLPFNSCPDKADHYFDFCHHYFDRSVSPIFFFFFTWNKYSQTVNLLFRPASFIQRDGFESLCCWCSNCSFIFTALKFDWVNMPQFIYPFHLGWTFGLFTVLAYDE